jgi:hypothetical protein
MAGAGTVTLLTPLDLRHRTCHLMCPASALCTGTYLSYLTAREILNQRTNDNYSEALGQGGRRLHVDSINQLRGADGKPGTSRSCLDCAASLDAEIAVVPRPESRVPATPPTVSLRLSQTGEDVEIRPAPSKVPGLLTGDTYSHAPTISHPSHAGCLDCCT